MTRDASTPLTTTIRNTPFRASPSECRVCRDDWNYTGVLKRLSRLSPTRSPKPPVRLCHRHIGCASTAHNWDHRGLGKSFSTKQNSSIMELSSVVLTSGGAFGFFQLVNAGVGRLPMPESARRNAWKWRNIAVSFVHSFITAIWAVLCFFHQPQMAEDLIETYSVFSHALVSFSIGYFLYDFSDMVLNQKLSQSWELILHHLVVITCFGLSVVSCHYVGFAVVALLVEINSVFLHLRQMLRMANMAIGTLYRVNSMINLGTYVVFRINTLAWMTRWLVLNRDNVPLLAYSMGSVGLAIMTAMNIVLFYRLLRSDFLKSSTRETKKEKEM